MGKNKLRKFAEMETIPLVFQYPYGILKISGFPLRGRWGREFFGNDNPITVELGCGKGEYTVGLARQYPGRNFIGIDIKGARMHAGATEAQREALPNVAFVRSSIELLEQFFAPGEVASIWVTFPDPQMRKPNKRLTGCRMMEMYRRVLASDGTVNLKTDSPFLYAYTRLMAQTNGCAILADNPDIDASGARAASPELSILTHYERQWLQRGLPIKWLEISPFTPGPLTEPPEAEQIPRDTYRSYSRGTLDGMPGIKTPPDTLNKL